MQAFGKASQPLGVVINPYRHEFSDGGPNADALRKGLDDLFKDHPNLLPVYRVHSAVKPANAENFFKFYKDRPVILAHDSPALSTAEFKKLTENPQVVFHIIKDQTVTAEQKNSIPSTKLIDLRDHFQKLQRNADYSGRELFTDRHKSVGKTIAGIGNYTIVGRNLELGGGPPGAIAIHSTFRWKKTADIWIEHFVSDETDRDVGDIGSKFLSAAEKLTTAVSSRPTEFGSNAAISEFQRHVKNGTFPGLGKNKEHQIHHHVRLMLSAVAE
jgi:hypothetical protein